MRSSGWSVAEVRCVATLARLCTFSEGSGGRPGVTGAGGGLAGQLLVAAPPGRGGGRRLRLAAMGAQFPQPG
jgi:hypothetical protein